MTTIAAILMLIQIGEVSYLHVHTILGFYTLIMILILAVGGAISAILHFCCACKWKSWIVVN